MKRKKTILFILTALVGILTSCRNPLPSQKQKYDFMKWYVQTQSVKDLSIKIKKLEPFHLKSDYLNRFELSVNDKKFINLQIAENANNQDIDKKSLPTDDWKLKNDKALSITHISLPVFSVDGNIAVIYKSYYCGLLCAEQGLEFYKKVKGQWQPLNKKSWAHLVS